MSDFYKNKETKLIFSADRVEEVKCPCCHSLLLVGVSEWFNGLRKAEDYYQITEDEGHSTKPENLEFFQQFKEKER